MVARDEELEGGVVVEEVLAHETRGDLVAAGQRLDLRFIPTPALLSFLCHDEPRTAQLGEIRWVTLAAGGNEGTHIRNRGVVADDRRDGIDEGALAVCAGAIGEDEFMFAGDAG